MKAAAGTPSTCAMVMPTKTNESADPRVSGLEMATAIAAATGVVMPAPTATTTRAA